MSVKNIVAFCHGKRSNDLIRFASLKPIDQTTDSRQPKSRSRRRHGHAAADLEGLFPLPLVPFESMTYFDNWPSYTMSCGAIFRFRGQINLSAFEDAMVFANRRHPLIVAVIEGKGARKRWIPSQQPFLPQWIGSETAFEFAKCWPYDLHNETGARIWVQQRNDLATVFAEFHHTCCDGAGGLAYMEDVFAAYAGIVNKGSIASSDLPPVDPHRLRQRGVFALPGGSLLEKMKLLLSDFARTHDLATKFPEPLAPPPQVSVPKPFIPTKRFISKVFDRITYQRLRIEAAQNKATLNDLLIHRLLTTIRAWNQQGGADLSGWLRILIPVNLRSRCDLLMPSTNRMGYGFLTRPQQPLTEAEECIHNIALDNSWMRQSGMPIRLLHKFAILQATGTWPLVFSPNRCLATAVFSNLGDPTRRFRYRFPRHKGLIQAGNLTMTSIEGTTALRPLTRAGLFFNTYGNRLTISARFDPKIYSTNDAESFLELFAQQIDARPRLLEAA